MARSKRIASPLSLNPSDEVNAMIIQPSRHRPKVGDIFVLNMCGKRWIVGRVIRTDAHGFGSMTKDNLLYFYRMEIQDPGHIETPISPDLLISPVMTNNLGWVRGYYLHVRNSPLLPEEILRQHVFESNLFAISDARRFRDEYHNPVPPPDPGPPAAFDDRKCWIQPWDPPRAPGIGYGLSGLWNYAAIDMWLSRALGLPAKDGAGVVSTSESEVVVATNVANIAKQYELVLHVPATQEMMDLVLDEVEEELIDAMKASGTGRWEGHGTDLKRGFLDIRFVGPQVSPMLEVLRPILSRLDAQLPSGWYLTSRPCGGSEESRIRL